MNPAPVVHKHPRYRVQADVDVLEVDASLRRLPLDNISLGGMFIRTPSAPRPGASLRLRLFDPTSELTVGLAARVVHVIDEPTSIAKRHPAGMGVQYQELPLQSAAQLRAFVERLAATAQPPRRAIGARFVEPRVVLVEAGREALRALWEQSLKVGGLFAGGQAPPLGTQVEVRIGQLRLRAEVVHVQPGVGAGLQLADQDGTARAALMRYLAGGVDELRVPVPAPRGPPLPKVLAVVRRLFAGIEAADGFAALGVPVTTDEGEVKQRVASLKRILSAPQPVATPPQAARIEGALRALARLEPALLARVVALRHEAELVPRPASTSPEQERWRALLDDAAAAEQRGDRHEARTHLTRALELVPGNDDVKRRLAKVQQIIDTARATEALGQAEVFAKGLGMKDEAARLARVALEASAAREVRLRALGVLAKSGFIDEAISTGEALLAADANDPLALQLLMHLYERTKQRMLAARTGEALLRLRPNDVELQQTVRRLIKAART